MRTAAILPVKRFASAKQRLGAALDGAARMALADAMVADVLTALSRVPALDMTIVVTGEEAARRLAFAYRAQVIEDPDDASHSAAAQRGIERALADGATRALLVPGDCPALDPAEVRALLDGHRDEGIVVVPDRHGTGTNALLLSPPDAIVPAFGEGSRERHEAAARASGLPVEVAALPSLGLDVDTAEDLEALREALGTSRGGAAHTRGTLAQLARAAAIPASR